MNVKCATKFASLALASFLVAQDTPLPKYKVVRNVEALNAAADQGYRLFVPGSPFRVLRLEGRPPDTYRYMAFTVVPRATDFLNWLNAGGAQGYRFIYRAYLPEKEPHPRNYAYTLAGLDLHKPASKVSAAGVLSPSVSAWLALMGQGYCFVALFGTGGLFEKDPDGGAVAAPGGWDVKLITGKRAENVVTKMNDLARQVSEEMFSSSSISTGKPGGGGADGSETRAHGTCSEAGIKVRDNEGRIDEPPDRRLAYWEPNNRDSVLWGTKRPQKNLFNPHLPT